MNSNLSQRARRSIATTLRAFVLGTAISGAVPAISIAQAGDQSIGVKLYVDQLHAIETTNSNFPSVGHEDRDETYIRVIGRGPDRQPIDHRLPSSNDRDDYYEFWQGTIRRASDAGGWSNKNQHRVHFPEIYEGVLEVGERAHFLVMFQEQDNDSLDQAREITKFIFKACETIAGGVSEVAKEAEAVEQGCKFAGEAAGLIPKSDSDEMIGAVLISPENVGGKLQMTYLAANGDAVGGAASTTRILGGSDGAFGLTAIDGALVDNIAVVEMIDNEGAGKYSANFRAEQIEPSAVVTGRRQIWNSDVERGTCRGGKPVSVKLSDGTYKPIAVGETILIKGDGNRGIEYKCGGSTENERGLFDRIYPEFAVERTEDKLNYYPYELVPYVSESAVGRAVAALSVDPDFAMAPGRRQQELTLSDLSPASGGLPAELAYLNDLSCADIRARDWSNAPVRPVVNWWSAGRTDNAAMVHPSWIGCAGDRRSPDYGLHRIDGFLYSPDRPQPEGTVPLYHWYNPKTHDNLLTGKRNFAHPDRAKPGGSYKGYDFVALAGYAFAPATVDTDGLVELHSWYSPGRGDWHALTHPHWNPDAQHPSTGGYDHNRFEGYLITAGGDH